MAANEILATALTASDRAGSTQVDAPVRADGPTQRCLLCEIRSDGTLVVETREGLRLPCDWLDVGAAASVALAPDDALLVAMPGLGEVRGVVLGRIGRYVAPSPVAELKLEATQSLALKCGATSVQMRADGKLMICGEDVLVRAKGTNRIRAGTVSIN